MISTRRPTSSGGPIRSGKFMHFFAFFLTEFVNHAVVARWGQQVVWRVFGFREDFKQMKFF